jgi:predicted protein tyrosine phosphatase
MKVLFVCSRNRLRSPTAEAVFANEPGIEASSAGTSADAENRVSLEDVEWADIIFAMEEIHRKKLVEMFPKVSKTKKIVVLRIPDRYAYMDVELIKVLKAKVPPFFRPFAKRSSPTGI